jgi:hypothetical protein
MSSLLLPSFPQAVGLFHEPCMFAVVLPSFASGVAWDQGGFDKLV